MTKQLIIAIDGPSGSGKSTLSKALARELGYLNIDTGAMFRCVALLAKRMQVDQDNAEQIAALCNGINIGFKRSPEGDRVLLNDEDVSEAIRTPEVSLLTSRVAANPQVRRTLLELQREMGHKGGVVLEGRDIGTVVFPDAEVKFFLSASAQERGRRRYEELRSQGVDVDLEQTIAEVEARDAADSSRTHAPLIRADDAIDIDSTRLTIEQVLRQMLRIIKERAGNGKRG